MVATTWMVPSVVFFTSIICWQYFVGHRSVPVGMCYVQYMESAIFNCLLQLGYFWATLVVMCALYTGIYRVALRLHRESAARRRTTAAAVADHTNTHSHHFGPIPSAASSSVYRLVATSTVADHAHRQMRRSSSDISVSVHDARPRRHQEVNDVTLLLPLPVNVAPAPRAAQAGPIELQAVEERSSPAAAADTGFDVMTFTVDDDDIRFADDVTEDDDDVIRYRAIPTSANDTDHRQLQQQQPTEKVASRDLTPTASLLEERGAALRHGAERREPATRVDTTGVPTRRRFCGHRLLSSAYRGLPSCRYGELQKTRGRDHLVLAQQLEERHRTCCGGTWRFRTDLLPAAGSRK